MSNHFAIPVPEMVDCHVMEYHWGRATLVIRLKRQNSPEVQYLKFYGVEYFAGPMIWTGANFEIRPPEECLQVLQMAERANELVTTKDLVERGYNLYMVSLPQTSVGIIAKNANRYSA